MNPRKISSGAMDADWQEAVLSVAAARITTDACTAGIRAGLRRSSLSCLACALLIAQGVRCALGGFLTTTGLGLSHVAHVAADMRRSSLAGRFAVLVAAHLVYLVFAFRLPWPLRRGASHQWSLFGRALLRSALYVAPAYPLLAVLSSTILMVASSSLRLAQRLHWLIELGSLHAPLCFVHVHARRNYTHPDQSDLLSYAARDDDDGATLPRYCDERDTLVRDREHARQQRLLRFWAR